MWGCRRAPQVSSAPSVCAAGLPPVSASGVPAVVVVVRQPLAIAQGAVSRPALVGWWTVDFVLLGAIVLGSFKFFACREVMEEGIFTLPTFEVVVALAAGVGWAMEPGEEPHEEPREERAEEVEAGV